MKFGVCYEIQLPTPHRDGDEGRMFREALEHVELADRLGIQHMWAVEHHFLDDHALSSARVVERIGTLDHISGGRVEFGTGESSSRMEIEGFGVDYATKRGAYLEALE